MKLHWKLIIYTVTIIVMLLVQMGFNMLWNNREIVEEGYISKSRATGLMGHIEYTIYKDGSQDVKMYNGWGHRLFGSELHQDLDGDDKIDRIRYNAPAWKFNRLTKVLIREHDAGSVFAQSDKQLLELK